MARAIWSGTVSFGLVAIPVSMVPAARPSRIAFHLLHDKDRARLRREMVCPAHDAKPVPPAHIVRGFEVEPGRYVTVSDEEIQALEPKRSRTIEITDFVDAAAIDPVYYDRPYYLLSGGADKPYRLLARSLEERNRAGIARFVLHDREHLAAVRSVGGVLALFTLHFADEIVSAADVAPSRAARPADVKTMEGLIRGMNGPFRPDRWPDPDEEKLRKLVASKTPVEAVEAAPAAEEAYEEPDTEPGDFIAALESSIARAKAARAGKRGGGDGGSQDRRHDRR